MENYFKLKENNTSVSTEVMAGITTFLAMSYIMIVNPAILGDTGAGIPTNAVFLATAFAAAASTLVMGLFANVPYALAPGMGLNAFFTYTVVFNLGFTWQQALSMVFICGIVNILITVTKIRKMLIVSIPVSLQHAIAAGIGVFIAYVGIKNAGFLEFSLSGGSLSGTVVDGNVVSALANGADAVPGLALFNNPSVLLAIIGLIVTIIFITLNIRGALLLSIFVTFLIGIPMGLVDFTAFTSGQNSLSQAFADLGSVFGVIFTAEGIPSLFNDVSKLPLVLMTIFAFSLSDVFDTIGTFIGTGRRTGIFSEEDEKAAEDSSGFTTKMDKALFADSIGTFVGAIFGTSNTTTYVESAAGIEAGGRTGLTSVVTAVLFLLSTLLTPIVSIVPGAATAPVLIIVGIMMLASLIDVNWLDITEAIPAFFASIFMGLSYSISYGIAAGFITFIVVRFAQKRLNEIHPIVWFTTALFILNFVILALI